MARYSVNARYAAVVCVDGVNQPLRLDVGDSVELDDSVAAFVERDCPGVLTAEGGEPEPTPEPEPEPTPEPDTDIGEAVGRPRRRKSS